MCVCKGGGVFDAKHQRCTWGTNAKSTPTTFLVHDPSSHLPIYGEGKLYETGRKGKLSAPQAHYSLALEIPIRNSLDVIGIERKHLWIMT